MSYDECFQYFNPTKPVILQVDASKRRLGSVLVQKDPDGRNKPVIYASKSLAPNETMLANIEHEMLPADFGCIRFHHYLYSQNFTCQSDHMPVEDIQLKHLCDGPQSYKGYS